MKIKTKEVFNIPNTLCYIRILLIPFFVATYLNASQPKDYYLASFLILLSGLTDTFDGYIARHFNQVTELGKAIDPVADKLTQFAIIFCLIAKYKFMLIVAAIFVVKELTQGILALFFMTKGKKIDGALWFGKISTIVFYVVTFTVIAVPTLSITTVNVLMGITGFFLLFSFINYLKAFNELKHSEPIKKESAEETNN